MLQKTAHIETYGCSANQNNSEILAGILSQAGFIITNNLKLAEIMIINTCIVKGKTESKIKRRIQDLQKEFKNILIIVTGCMPQTDIKNLKKISPTSLFLGTNRFRDILNLIRDHQENKLTKEKQEYYISSAREIKLNLPKKPLNPLISIHQISEGCVGNCTYCKTKLAKGNLYSYPKKDILKSIESDLAQGAKEVWLTSEDGGAYGLDLSGKSLLPELLREILELKHKFKLRLGMANPNNLLPILPELIEVFKDKKMYKFLHLPIQSASNNVLKDMNRYYKIEDAQKIITFFKKEFPNVVIATDIIVGYPTETNEDHRKNREFIENYKPDVLNISKFSSHKETAAGKLKILSSEIIKKRTTELMDIHRKTSKENKEKFLNKEIEVFINKKVSEELYEARDENYNIVLIKADKVLLGKTIKVKIIETGVHHLIGKDIIF